MLEKHRPSLEKLAKSSARVDPSPLAQVLDTIQAIASEGLEATHLEAFEDIRALAFVAAADLVSGPRATDPLATSEEVQAALLVPTPRPLTREDVDQIIEGIEEFIIQGYEDLVPVWQPYIDKLAALRETLP